MKKHWIIVGFMTLVFIASGISADRTSAGGTIKPPDRAVSIDGKKPVKFKHATHLKLGLECGKCHHDVDHKPLTAVAIGSMPDSAGLQCANCHNKKFANAKLQRRKDVFHAGCKTCHKLGFAGKTGPTKCSGCHEKKPKKAIEGC